MTTNLKRSDGTVLKLKETRIKIFVKSFKLKNKPLSIELLF